MIEELCNQIIQRNDFATDYEKLALLNYSSFFNHGSSESFSEKDTELIRRLLQVASTFALSENVRFRKIAYEIAVMCNNLEKRIGNTYYTTTIVPLVFTRLGNFPAEKKFCNDHGMKSIALPPPLWFEQEIHRKDNTIKIADSVLTLTDFQMQLWESVNHYPVTIVNAPTSAGKSFILQNHIVNAVAFECMCAVYIVPTRALIEQVINDFRNIMNKAGIQDIVVSAIPDVPNGKKTIYVLTQERTQLLLENEFQIDITVVDEAQNVSDSARGIILQSVVETIKRKNENVKFIFATPFVQNPKLFLHMFSLDETNSKIIPIGESPVSQNLFSVSLNKEKTHLFDISKLREDGKFYPVGSLYSELEILNEKHYLAILALEAGKDDNNIIYGNEPTKCEEIAQLIAQQLPELSHRKELIEFSDYLKEHIHRDYLLADTIRHGVAYHYGKLPAFIRKGIERLCSSGDIKFIICTSTLLQGVNLPAKNIFISNPSKGQDAHRKSIPMNAPDFWNLAGRAGRLTKDFEGNVFLLNLNDWEINPVAEPEKQAFIIPSFKKTICDSESDICAFIKNKDHKSGQQATQSYENAFMKLYFLESTEQLESTLEGYGDSISNQGKNEIIGLIKDIKPYISLPDEIVLKNPNVSVFRQQALYDYFNSHIDTIEGFIPQHPLRPFNTIKGSFIELFKTYNHKLANVANNTHLFYYWFALNWMKGTAYKDLLKNQIEHNGKKRKRGQPNVNTEARNLFDAIETKLRFEYVKFSKCYNDILSYTLKENGKEELIESIPPLHLYLELGASSQTMINLIGIGLSRTAAGLLSNLITNASMSRDGVLDWLKRVNLNTLDLPNSVKEEIKQVV